MRIYRSNRTKLDKIFDNKYDEAHCPFFDTIFFKFKIEDNNSDEELNMHYQIVFNDMIKYIYKKCYHMNTHIKYNHLEQLHTIFNYFENVLNNKYNLLDIFYFILYYFDVEPNKLYKSLSISIKDKLIKELLDENVITQNKYDILINENRKDKNNICVKYKKIKKN